MARIVLLDRHPDGYVSAYESKKLHERGVAPTAMAALGELHRCLELQLRAIEIAIDTIERQGAALSRGEPVVEMIELPGAEDLGAYKR